MVWSKILIVKFKFIIKDIILGYRLRITFKDMVMDKGVEYCLSLWFKKIAFR
jgi:hypothetical protein